MSVPGNASPLLLTSAAGAAAGYQISRSVRFNSSDSAYLSRTPGTAGNRKTWTWAGWVKRTVKNTATDQMLFTGGTTSSDTGFLALDFNSSDKLRLSSAATNFLITTAVYRDSGAWMHIVLAFDATQGTNANKAELYVNGTEVTVFDTDGRSSISNQDYGVNQAAAHEIGRASLGSNKYLDGYLADVHLIDGQALDPTSFGEFDTNGVWQPKAFSGGSYGTNGFRLPFSDNSTAAALGTDTSPNGNTWTVNNISASLLVQETIRWWIRPLPRLIRQIRVSVAKWWGITALNFGQRPFAYTAPSGFKALCTTNLPEPTIADGSTVMDVALYTGNGSTQTISGLNFSSAGQTGLVWIKSRSSGTWHNLTDAVRGVNKSLFSNSTIAETAVTDIVTALSSTGFTLGADANADGTNISGASYAAWCWASPTSTSTNTEGSITSQVRANASAGFSVVTYTGAGSTSSTIGHGLGVAPSFIIAKARTTASQVNSWRCYHRSLGATQYLTLNATDAAGTFTDWANTSPTSTLFYVGGTNTTFPVNESGINYVAYCFAPVAGYSSFGSYTGNGSTDGPFVYTGFRPRWILYKRTDDHWLLVAS
jgi:hypothetical protein